MSDRFSFKNDKSVLAFENLVSLAKNNDEKNDLAEALSQLIESTFSEVRISSLLDKFNTNLKTVREYQGFDPTIAWTGGSALFKNAEVLLKLEWFSIFLCIYMKEMSFRLNFTIDPGNSFFNLTQFVSKNKDKFSKESEWCLSFYDDLYFIILKEFYHSPNIQAVLNIIKSNDIDNVNNFIKTKDETVSKIEAWNNEFNDKVNAVNDLKDKLDTYHVAFNFVGLNKGFLDLKEIKDKELKNQNILYYVIFTILIVIPIYELYFVSKNLEQLDINKMGFIIFPTITILFILFWFLKIVLSQIKSIKSQIMQLELRMTLCKFIQNYAETSKDLKSHNKEGFEKFENLIFSSIVSSDEKIPATFDGMEQITSLIKSLNNR